MPRAIRQAEKKKAHPFVVWLFGFMEHQKITQTELCKKSGVSRNVMLGWRKGSIEPSLTSLEKVLKALDCVLVIRYNPPKGKKK